ncbi:hypothetical protein HG536_0B04160 [Torulaspora globosa]|uniref:Mitochondrial intermembrane space cysteine motif-containing protein MIX23 n=1 Tax=Torulaspora globosa TaxID=48254 RepID=A0A7G3ZDG6_9SACH|nr:uncharacterized protein HG536_0B04160 [Torulaspora globosa]QLL31552.1 hypothetical protein HG536_0B04160 [Torulaspora globosa]
MSSDSIEVTAPEALLDANLSFPEETPLIRHLTMTRERCVDPTLADSFLRLLRYGSDDSIKQRLSAYQRHEENSPFKNKRCGSFLRNELYPNWQARNRIITFCRNQLEDMKAELDEKYGQHSATPLKAEVDLRIDPYAAKDRQHEQENRYKELKRLNTWIENQIKIESILLANSNRTLQQNCDQNVNYINEFWKFHRATR